MAKETAGQRKTVGRVMHEYAHGELKSGPKGKGGKVKSRKQAIAIALKEAGELEVREQERRTAAISPGPSARKRRGKTAQQENEGKSHVGARGKRESSRAMGGKDAKRADQALAGARRRTTRKAA